jgi:ABC-type transporter Mla MlaB component
MGKIAKGPRNAAIDPDSAQVQRLKSAAVPLIMSFNEDQKQEVRSMLRLMGLENLATQF